MADDNVVVTLVQTASDKGQKLLMHRVASLPRSSNARTLKKIGRPDLLVELVKRLLFDETQAVLPQSPRCYEIRAPKGLTERADAMVAERPNGLEIKKVLSAFQKVTATYKTLEHFCWDETGAKLIERLKTQVHRKREDGMTLSQLCVGPPLFTSSSSRQLPCGAAFRVELHWSVTECLRCDECRRMAALSTSEARKRFSPSSS